MKLYVGTYGKYNSGSIEGAWVDLNDYADKDEFIEACLELHEDEHDPELMFQDCECDNELEEQFYDESYISEDYWNYKDAIDNCGLEADVVAEYMNKISCNDVMEGIKKAEDNFQCSCSSLEAWAEEECESYFANCDLPWWITNHIDWEGIARELECDCEIVEVNNTYYIFGCD